MKLANDCIAGVKQSQEITAGTDKDTVDALCTETHAYVTPPLDLAQAQIPHTINFGIISETETYSNGGTKIGNTDRTRRAEIKTSTLVPMKLPLSQYQRYQERTYVDRDTFISRKSSSEIIDEAAQLVYGEKLYLDIFENRSSPYASRNTRMRYEKDQSSDAEADNIKSSEFQVHVTCADAPKSRPIDHIYEEIGSVAESPNLPKYDILDYYEKYSPTTAKMLIDTLFLPTHKICQICAATQRSVIYSDRLIRFNQPLKAKEVTFFQVENSLYFKQTSDVCYSNFKQFTNDQDSDNFIPVYNTAKPNTSGILYSNNLSTDVFDLKSTLEPTIRLLVDNDFRGLSNTELYHRNAKNFYSRKSANGFAPMVFNDMRNNGLLETIKSIGYETDLNNWMNYRKDVVKLRNSKPNELPLSVIEPHPDRSSLLLLEPLLLMPELSSNPRRNQAKNRITHSEHLKIVRMMIAYTLAFFLLAIVTFYIIYFS